MQSSVQQLREADQRSPPRGMMQTPEETYAEYQRQSAVMGLALAIARRRMDCAVERCAAGRRATSRGRATRTRSLNS